MIPRHTLVPPQRVRQSETPPPAYTPTHTPASTQMRGLVGDQLVYSQVFRSTPSTSPQTIPRSPRCRSTFCCRFATESSRYCRKHQCCVDGCDSRREWGHGRRYCLVHACRLLECERRRAGFSNYCALHTCEQYGCYALSLGIRYRYCDAYTCRSQKCLGLRHPSSTYCSDHNTAWNDYNSRAESV